MGLAPYTGLESGGVKWGEAGEGVTQGDPKASSLFCIALQKDLREFDVPLAEVGGFVRGANDDILAVGPPDILFPALIRFEEAAWNRCGLRLERTKTEVFTWDGVLPPGTPEGL